jgi:hypothetical protein
MPTPPTLIPSGAAQSLDLDGMTVMADALMPPVGSNQHVGTESTLSPLREGSEEDVQELPWGNAPATATWAPMMEEVR